MCITSVVQSLPTLNFIQVSASPRGGLGGDPGKSGKLKVVSEITGVLNDSDRHASDRTVVFLGRLLSPFLKNSTSGVLRLIEME